MKPALAWPSEVTTTLPVVAPAGTVATMAVALQLVVEAAVPLNVTEPGKSRIARNWLSWLGRNVSEKANVKLLDRLSKAGQKLFAYSRLKSAIILSCVGATNFRGESSLSKNIFDGVGDEDWTPRYNVAPTQPVPIIRQNRKEPRRELSLVRWGLIPWWAKDSSSAASMINARSETAATKPAFRDALRTSRGISYVPRLLGAVTALCTSLRGLGTFSTQ